MKIVRLLSILAILVLFTSVYATPFVRASAAGAGHQSLATLAFRGIGVLSSGGNTSATDAASSEFPPATRILDSGYSGHSVATSSSAPLTVPTPVGKTVVNTNPGVSGFNGLTHKDQRNSGTGKYTNTNFSLEPPDQALCVSGRFVLEAVNDALAVYDHTGKLLSGPTANNQFFNLAPEIVRPIGPFGDFTGDPKCYFDSATHRFYLTLVQIDVDPATGNLNPHSHTEIAVSKTSDPTGPWNLYGLDTTDDGTNGTPSHADCPCFGDQPLIGADSSGFYITTNEFPIFVNGFDGAQVYAMSKTALAAGSLPTVVHIDASQALVPFGGLSYTIQPATSPPGQRADIGTEYFLSALEFTGGLDNRIAVWALTGTGSLNNDSPNVSLSFAVIQSEVYGQPPVASQKDGFRPLGGTRPVPKLDSNDNRMNQVVNSGGILYAGVNTIVKTANGAIHVGIAYFAVQPNWDGNRLVGTVVQQGYVSVNGEDVMFPSIGLNADATGIMTFTLTGPVNFPSAAFVRIDSNRNVGNVHIAAAGAGPEDGFTGYPRSGAQGVARWGDYSAAVAAPGGSIWFATEYIPNLPRTVNANWGTFIANAVDLQNLP